MAVGNLFGAPAGPGRWYENIPELIDALKPHVPEALGPSSLDPWRSGTWPWGQQATYSPPPYLPTIWKGLTPYQKAFGARPPQGGGRGQLGPLASGPNWINMLPFGYIGPSTPASTGGMFGGITPGNQPLANIFGQAAAQGVAQGMGPFIGTTSGQVLGQQPGGAGAAGGQAPKEPQYKPMPPGMDLSGTPAWPGWWEAFQDEHEGETPLEYYGAQGYGDESLRAALEDLEWSQQFAADAGHGPSDYDWNAWWYHKQGMYSPVEYEAYKKKLDKQRKKAKADQPAPRPPTWIPEQTWWDL